MKKIHVLILMLLAVFGLSSAKAESWIVAPNVVTDISRTWDDAWVAGYWSKLSGNTGQIAAQISNTSYAKTYWLTYFSDGAYKNQGYHSDGTIILPCKRTSASASTESQFFTSFTLSDELLNAEKVKIEATFIKRSGIGFEVGVGGWDDEEIIIMSDVAASSAANNYHTQFTIGLINLETGESYGTTINGEDTLLFDGLFDGCSTWSVETQTRVNENGTETEFFTISFELSQEDLATITSAGLGFVIATLTPDGTTTFSEAWSTDGFTVSYVIPEPATCAAIFGVLMLGFAAYRRRNAPSGSRI